MSAPKNLSTTNASGFLSIMNKISEISAILDYNLESEKSPIEHNAYWQGKHPHTELWREAGWKAKPIEDKNSGKIVAVKFINLAQGKFI